MKIGYARVSTDIQKTDMQLDALRAAGCEVIFQDVGESGRKGSRPELDKCLASLKPGDTLVVWKLDRLFRSVLHFSRAWQSFHERGVSLISITQAFDSSTPTGKLMMNILASFAEFESDTISERTKGGIHAAKARGVKWNAGKIKTGEVSRSTRYRRLKMREISSRV